VWTYEAKRSALQFAANESEAFGIGNDADYDGLITDFGNDLEVLGDFLSLSKCTSRIWQCPEHLMCVIWRVRTVTPMRADLETPQTTATDRGEGRTVHHVQSICEDNGTCK
jgi:hypothetical protein